MFDRTRIRSRFGRAAGQYARRALLQSEVAGRLLERLDGLRFSPSRIVDLGCGPGLQARALCQRFPKARVTAMDLALPMLEAARGEAGWRGRRFDRVAADAHALPLADASVDLVYSSLMLQWSDDLPSVLRGIRRVLRPGGLLLFSTFGPDTLVQLREAWAKVDAAEHVSRFADVQTVGDEVMRAGFTEPVLDTDWITSTYARPADLLGELRAIGANHATQTRTRGLTPPARMRAMLAAYEEFRIEGGAGDRHARAAAPDGTRSNGRYPATWEVIYASAWAPDHGAPIRSGQGEEASIPVSEIGRRRRE